MILIDTIIHQALRIQHSEEQQRKPHLGLILLVAYLFGMPTICWIIQVKAALQQPDNSAVLENYTETGEVF